MTEANNNKSAQKIGDAMRDGSIYAGTSPDTGKPMYAMPKDASSSSVVLMTPANTRLPPTNARNWVMMTGAWPRTPK